MEDKSPALTEMNDIHKAAEAAFDEQVKDVQPEVKQPESPKVEEPKPDEKSEITEPTVEEKKPEEQKDINPVDDKKESTDNGEEKEPIKPEVEKPSKPNVFAKGEFSDDEWDKTPESVKAAVNRVTKANAQYFAKREETFKEVDPYLFQIARQAHISKDQVLRNCASWAQEMTDNPDGAFIKATTPVDGKVALRLNHPEIIVNHLINLYGLESDTLKPVEIDKDKIQLISEKNRYEIENKRNERLNEYSRDNESLANQDLIESDIRTFIELHPDDTKRIDADAELSKRFEIEVEYQRKLDSKSSNVVIMEKAANVVLGKTANQVAAKPEGIKPRGAPVSVKSSTAGEVAKAGNVEGFKNQVDEMAYIRKIASGA